MPTFAPGELIRDALGASVWVFENPDRFDGRVLKDTSQAFLVLGEGKDLNNTSMVLVLFNGGVGWVLAYNMTLVARP